MDMKELVPLLAKGAILLIVASYGLQTHPRDLLTALRDKGLMVRAMIAVNLVVPLTAVVLCLLLPIPQDVRIGIVIMAISPLAPLVTSKVHAGGVRTSVVLGPYVALILAAVVLVPLTVALLSAIFPPKASISVWALAKLVALSILVPTAFGLAINARYPRFAEKAAKVAATVGFAILALLVVVILYAEGSALISLLGDGTLVAISGTVVAGILAGHLLGRPDPKLSNGLALAAAIRHPGIAMLIAHQNFTDRRVMLAIILFLLTSIVVASIYQRWARMSSRVGAATV